MAPHAAAPGQCSTRAGNTTVSKEGKKETCSFLDRSCVSSLVLSFKGQLPHMEKVWPNLACMFERRPLKLSPSGPHSQQPCCPLLSLPGQFRLFQPSWLTPEKGAVLPLGNSGKLCTRTNCTSLHVWDWGKKKGRRAFSAYDWDPVILRLGYSAEFCGMGGQVMSAPETSLVSVICATPPFPRSPCRSFKRTLPVSCFQSEAVLSGLGSQAALTAQQAEKRSGALLCVPHLLPWPCPWGRQEARLTARAGHCRRVAVRLQSCLMVQDRNAGHLKPRMAGWCGRQRVPCSHTVSHDDTVINGWWVEESERKRIGGTETKVRHRVRSSNSNGQRWIEAGAGDRVGLAEN